jgi:hypothetical protein
VEAFGTGAAGAAGVDEVAWLTPVGIHIFLNSSSPIFSFLMR